jgi:hypothetical protein
MPKIVFLAATLAATLAPVAARSATPEELMRGYAQQARREAQSYSGPSASAGRRFFTTKHGEWSCSDCHTSNPGASGRHTVTGKAIAPLAPAANAERFRDPARVEKWFKRNCNDTVARACTAAEKADVLAYLISVRPGA